MRIITKYFRDACFWDWRLWLLSKISFFILFFFLTACSETPQKHRKAFICLSDGTKVFKDDLAILRVDSGFNQTSRVVFLEGKSDFEVQHIVYRPFIIRTRLLKIIVGEESNAVFSIDASDTSANGGEEVDLLRGSLNVVKAYHSENDNQPLIINSGEMIMVNKGIDLIENEKLDTTEWKKLHYAND